MHLSALLSPFAWIFLSRFHLNLPCPGDRAKVPSTKKKSAWNMEDMEEARQGTNKTNLEVPKEKFTRARVAVPLIFP